MGTEEQPSSRGVNCKRENTCILGTLQNHRANFNQLTNVTKHCSQKGILGCLNKMHDYVLFQEDAVIAKCIFEM